jgi:hypothetical protein
MAPPLVIPAPTRKTGSITFNSTYAKDIVKYTRNTNKSVLQYGDIVFGVVEFQAATSVTTQGTYNLFTINGVSKPAVATPAV